MKTNFKKITKKTLIGACAIIVIILPVLYILIIAAFAMPKLFRDDHRHKIKALTKSTYALVGEAYLSRLADPDLPKQDIPGGTEGNIFGDYLFEHLNFLNSSVTDPAVTNDYCPVDDYFEIPDGSIIRSICNETAPSNHLKVTIYVPARIAANDITFDLVIPEGQEFYTTKYGLTGVVGDCVVGVDDVLNVVDVCP